jgi:hypothetical protein
MSETEHAPVATGIEALVIADITARQQSGLLKYGQTVAENPLPLRAWLRHAYEECLDQAVYLRRAIEEMDSEPAPLPTASPCPACEGHGGWTQAGEWQRCPMCKGEGLVISAEQPARNVPVERIEFDPDVP